MTGPLTEVGEQVTTSGATFHELAALSLMVTSPNNDPVVALVRGKWGEHAGRVLELPLLDTQIIEAAARRIYAGHDVNEVDGEGRTALGFLAAHSRWIRPRAEGLLHFLIERGAQPLGTDVPLAISIHSQSNLIHKMVDHLLEQERSGRGARDAKGACALHFLMDRDSLVINHILLAGMGHHVEGEAYIPGAWVHARDEAGDTPLLRLWQRPLASERERIGNEGKLASYRWNTTKALLDSGALLTDTNQRGQAACDLIREAVMSQAIPVPHENAVDWAEIQRRCLEADTALAGNSKRLAPRL